MQELNHRTDTEPTRFTKRIGPTTFHVAVFFSPTSKETVDDKILRLVERDATTQDQPQPCYTAGKRLP